MFSWRAILRVLSRQHIHLGLRHRAVAKDISGFCNKSCHNFNQETDELRTKLRAAEEEAKSVRERLHNTNKSYNTTLEELHAAERNLQQAKGKCALDT